MKLIISYAILITLLISFPQIKPESLSATVFDFLNDFVSEGNRGNAAAPNDFRFVSMQSNQVNATNSNTPSPPTNSSKAAVDIVNLNDPNLQISEWMTISSPAFANQQKFPQLNSPDGTRALIDLARYERVNANFNSAKAEGSPSEKAFWFLARGGYIYYSSTQKDINVLDAIFAKQANNLKDFSLLSNNTASCFTVRDFDNNDWKLCAGSVNTKLKWLCSLQKFLNQELDYFCTNTEEKKALVNMPGAIVEIKKVVQPVIIIPTASKHCNEKWDYVNKGSDWECICKEGRSQSPIDLPKKSDAKLSPLRPMFQYDLISSTASESTIDGLLTAGESIKIRYEKGAIRLYHHNLGKIVALDGGVYIAEEISFHTPSEHMIGGKRFEMEMQIVHYGRSKGDISKQVIFSFLFKRSPGVYNKLMDKLDFFNLPNPFDTYKELTQDLFVPSVFYNSDEDDIPTLQPFSFYTYEGSLTTPPCSERTTHYVVADPIPLSNTVITLFKEALKKPDMVNANDPTDIIINDEGDIENNRNVQPLNGRAVFLFDHKRYGCFEFKPKKRNVKPAGHYEKVERDSTEYIYVTGKEPSGLPGSFIVSEQEAKGH